MQELQIYIMSFLGPEWSVSTPDSDDDDDGECYYGAGGFDGEDNEDCLLGVIATVWFFYY